MPGKQESNLAAVPTYCACNVCLALTRSWIEMPFRKKKSSQSILLLFSSEIQHCYISYPVAIIHSQRYLLLGKYCPIDASQTWKLWFLSKGAERYTNTKAQKWNFPFFLLHSTKKIYVVLLFRVILHAMFIKTVMEINSVFFGPLCWLHCIALFGIISVSHLKKKNQERA